LVPFKCDVYLMLIQPFLILHILGRIYLLAGITNFKPVDISQRYVVRFVGLEVKDATHQNKVSRCNDGTGSVSNPITSV
jgi:hypothetical protein